MTTPSMYPNYQNNQFGGNNWGPDVYGMPRVNPSANYFNNVSISPVQNFSQISGRIIDSPEEVTPQEVPMNGSASLFPLKDGSCIYAKSWNANGTIRTSRYILENPDEEGGVNTPNTIDMVMERLDKIEKMLMENSRNNCPSRQPKVPRDKGYKQDKESYKKKEDIAHEQSAT